MKRNKGRRINKCFILNVFRTMAKWLLSLSIVVICVFFNPTVSQSEENRPNIVILIVDDLGIGDIGCFGNSTLRTPNIDSLCRDGAKLDHHLATATLCTPSRAAFMTGRYAVRMGMTGIKDPVGAPVIMYGGSRAGLPPNETSWATLLHNVGYTTAAIGKWHLGINEWTWGDQLHGPLGHGFDYFYGLPFTLVDGFELNLPFFSFKNAFDYEILVVLACTLPLLKLFKRRIFAFIFFVVTMAIAWFFLEHFEMTKGDRWFSRSPYMEKFLNSYLMENNQVIEKPIDLETLSDKLVKTSIRFIQESSKSGNPFLLYHSFAHVHTPLATSSEYLGKSQHGIYGDAVEEVDGSVGKILETLKKTNVDENTMVYFTSDHGGDYPQLGRLGGLNGIFRGGKANGALEGGMRVPGIVRWPGVVEPGSTVIQPTSLIDILPTLADIAKVPLPPNRTIDGRSMLPYWTSARLSTAAITTMPQRTIYHHCGSDIFAMRRSYEDGSIYKLIMKEPELNENGGCDTPICLCFDNIVVHPKPKLYDIVNDPTEMNPIEVTSQLYKNVARALLEELKKFQKEVDETKMPGQFSSFWKLMPMPWLQPLLEV